MKSKANVLKQQMADANKTFKQTNFSVALFHKYLNNDNYFNLHNQVQVFYIPK